MNCAKKCSREALREHNRTREQLQIIATQIATQLGGKGWYANGRRTLENARSADKMGLSWKEQNTKGHRPGNFKTGALNHSATLPYPEIRDFFIFPIPRIRPLLAFCRRFWPYR